MMKISNAAWQKLKIVVYDLGTSTEDKRKSIVQSDKSAKQDR